MYEKVRSSMEKTELPCRCDACAMFLSKCIRTQSSNPGKGEVQYGTSELTEWMHLDTNIFPGANMQTVRSRFIIPLLLSIALPASAGCIANDKWTGRDKKLHLIGGAMAGSFATVITHDPWKGFYTGAAIGVAKELVDLQDKENSTCSLQDLFATVAGSAIGAYTAGRILVNYNARQKQLNVAVAIPLQF